MGRTPCCERVGLKRGPWTSQEDRVLINYISQNGHGNWRTLPNRAGLLRCGKSCRLRWVNYLRPDIKRGNFTTEEEETIITLHQKMGNKWSRIAARLPRRTDNEIKNFWNTHLKKRVNGNSGPSDQPEIDGKREPPSGLAGAVVDDEQQCFRENSSSTTATEESFWLEVFEAEELCPAGAGNRLPVLDFDYESMDLDGSWQEMFHKLDQHRFSMRS